MPLFDFKLKEIFTTVKEPVDKGMTPEQEEAFVLAKVKKEFGPLFDKLLSLPEKDGKKFTVSFGKTKDELGFTSFAAEIAYKPAKSAFGNEYAFFAEPVHGEAQPAIKLTFSLANEVFSANVTEKYIPFHPERTHFTHPFQKSTPFAKAMKDVMQGLGKIAPDRIAEIGTVPAAKPQTLAV